MRIQSGTTDRYVYFVAVDSTDLRTREPGLSSFTVYRSRNGEAAAAYTSPTVNEVDAANMPGVYELLIDEDTTIDSANDSEEYVVHITQASMAPVTRVIELYRNVWDEVLTGATHNVPSSAGRRLRQVEDVTVLSEGTAQSATASTVVLEAGEDSNDEYYQHALIVITGGTGAGQARSIHDYDGGTLTADIVPDWITTPSGDIKYTIYAFGEVHVHEVHAGAIIAASFAAGEDELTSVPAKDASLHQMIQLCFLWIRNKVLTTSSTHTLRNDADNADIGSCAIDDDETTFTKGKMT